ncbi:MAG: MFS transporter [Cyclobacteriaceae bacterium]|nr:MFS transporter [Cyclobacteriaceae bacterium]
MATNKKVYNTQFWLVCLSSLLFFSSFNMMIPELSGYLSSLGGAEYKGLIISLFTLTALISRPFSGKLADTIGRVPIMFFGTAVCIICSLLYPILASVSGFLFLRLIHGFSTGFTPTGLTAYLSDVIPAEKRGEAMGILGTAGSIGMAAGPAMGGAIANHFSLDALFYASSVFATASVAILFTVKETLQAKKKFTLSALKLERHDLLELRVIIPCIIMLLACYAYGAIFTVLPDFGLYIGIKNKGVPFTFLTIASLAVRLIAGKLSDRIGRVAVLRLSTFLIVVGMVIIAFAHNPFMALTGITIYGMAQGMTSPTLFAWATDLSLNQFKGRGIASLYIFMEAGIGIGALASGFIYGNDDQFFTLTFAVCAMIALIGFLYLTFFFRKTHLPKPE